MVQPDRVTKIELEAMGKGAWDVVLVRTRGTVLSGTVRYPADSVDLALSIAKAFMDEEAQQV